MKAPEKKPVPGLRSPREEVGGLVYFGRMVDKLRLEQAGRLPEDYHENMGKGFDAACCDFLGVSHEALGVRVREGGSDRELLEWCLSHGHPRDAQERAAWSATLSQRGWRDDLSERLIFRKKEAGWQEREGIQTFFDYLDADEGRS